MRSEEGEKNVHKNDFKMNNSSSRDYREQCKFIEEYDPALNEWKVVGEIPNNF